MEITDSYQFSFFRKPILNTEPLRAVGIIDIYRYIVGHYAMLPTAALRNLTNKAEAKRYKATHFDYCTFSGLFRKRREDDLLMHSGLMCIDFDHVPDLIGLKQRLLADEYFGLYRYCPWMRGMATSQISCNNGIDKKASHVPL